MKIAIVKKAELKKIALIKCPFIVEDYATDKK